MKKKIIGKSFLSKESCKPSTITRAGITADIKYTRGKQLVEHDPFKLIPDPHNPRPGEIVDETWLCHHLLLGTENSLCKVNQSNGDYEIPELSTFDVEINSSLEESYNFLRDLAYSIRVEGLIEPIEIFLADRENEPDYFTNNQMEYGYVILEGHQRRLAAMMAGVSTVTCIEITDESFLAKLKVKHRKLRRQLSENNLRKGLTVSQNFQIVQTLLSTQEGANITARELSSIIGLNEAIAATLKKICCNPEKFPLEMISRIKNNELTFKRIRNLISKSYSEIETALNTNLPLPSTNRSIKTRGRKGGAIKKSAIFKITDVNESNVLHKFLMERFPELDAEGHKDTTFKSLESILNKIKELALQDLV
jgi:hypothetical protein